MISLRPPSSTTVRGDPGVSSVSSSNALGGAAVRAPGQDSQEAAGEAAGPAPAPAADAEVLGAAPAGRTPPGMQSGQRPPGRCGQKQELSGKGACGRRLLLWACEPGAGGLHLREIQREVMGAAFARCSSERDHSLERGRPRHRRHQPRGQGRGCQAVVSTCPARTGSLSSVFVQPRRLFGRRDVTYV